MAWTGTGSSATWSRTGRGRQSAYAGVRALPGLVAVRGNTDRYVLTEPPDPVMTASFDWTRSRLSADDLAWLGALPVEARPQDGVLLVHASPGRDDGPGLDPHDGDDASVARGFAAGAADLILVGHTHHPDERRLGRSARREPRLGQPAAHLGRPGPLRDPHVR